VTSARDDSVPRIEPADVETAGPEIRAVLESQRQRWGEPLINHLIYARRPTIFRGVRSMWDGIGGSGLIDEALQAMVNRFVASLNGCPF
jgi:hypothetical protein